MANRGGEVMPEFDTSVEVELICARCGNLLDSSEIRSHGIWVCKVEPCPCLEESEDSDDSIL